MKTLVIAAPHSGCGKTTLTAGLIAALCARGECVQPFKVGPDYIDPSYHTLAAGRTCRNLDSWMLPGKAYQDLFARATRDASCAMIEGVMGLYDGARYDSEEGSTAEIAKQLGASVVVVLDAAKVARTIGAVALGMQNFDPAVKIIGYIANNVASAGHGQGVATAITAATGKPCFGWVQRHPALQLPERHLGLVPTVENGDWAAFVQLAGEIVTQQIDLDALWQAIDDRSALDIAMPAPRIKVGERPRIAVAQDAAFSFLYPENLELLREAGAEIVAFSPLRDPELPLGAQGVYLCGGFPELYAAQLAANQAMHAALRQAQAQQLPIYAECGGLMALTEAIIDGQGERLSMAGLLPGVSTMTTRLTLGYRVVRALTDNWLWRAGEEMRGHEFHYSVWAERPATAPYLYEFQPHTPRHTTQLEGISVGSVVASYTHLHFLANPILAERFVQAAAQVMLGSTAR
ncbi:cobyrinate a,c-diamide synthase [soil metagenome]